MGKALDAATAFLRAELSRGTAMSPRDIQAKARAAGIAWRTVRRAQESMGVVPIKLRDRWVWTLPRLDAVPRRSRQGVHAQGQGVQKTQGGEALAKPSVSDDLIAALYGLLGPQHDQMEHLQRVIRELQWVHWETRFRPLAAWCEVMIECAGARLNALANEDAP